MTDSAPGKEPNHKSIQKMIENYKVIKDLTKNVENMLNDTPETCADSLLLDWGQGTSGWRGRCSSSWEKIAWRTGSESHIKFSGHGNC